MEQLKLSMSSLVLGKMATVSSHMEATYSTLMRFTKPVVNSSLMSSQLVDISIHLKTNSTLDSLLRPRGAGNLSQGRGRRGKGRERRRERQWKGSLERVGRGRGELREGGGLSAREANSMWGDIKVLVETKEHFN